MLFRSILWAHLPLPSPPSLPSHSEAAAGLVGLLEAAACLAGCASVPVLHLRAVSTNVREVMGRAAVARQSGPFPVDARPVRVVGTSSFAFQGTNAHVLTSCPAGRPAPSTLRSARLFRRTRFFPICAPHPMLRYVAPGSDSVLFVSPCASSSWSAAIFDHTVLGRPIMPGAAFIESASAVRSHYNFFYYILRFQ